MVVVIDLLHDNACILQDINLPALPDHFHVGVGTKSMLCCSLHRYCFQSVGSSFCFYLYGTARRNLGQQGGGNVLNQPGGLVGNNWVCRPLLTKESVQLTVVCVSDLPLAPTF